MLDDKTTGQCNLRGRILEVSILAISVVVYSQIPNDFPLLPNISFTEISNHLCVYRSFKSLEIPEWNPYLGGGFPLSPSSKYTFFYGIDRTTFAVLMSILTLICLIVEGSNKLSSILIFSFYVISLITYSPVPMSICLLSVGIINNSRVARIISTMITPGLSLLYELSIKNPSWS